LLGLIALSMDAQHDDYADHCEIGNADVNDDPNSQATLEDLCRAHLVRPTLLLPSHILYPFFFFTLQLSNLLVWPFYLQSSPFLFFLEFW